MDLWGFLLNTSCRKSFNDLFCNVFEVSKVWIKIVDNVCTSYIIELTGILHIGAAHIKRQITSSVMVTMSVADPMQCYFYSKIESLDFKSLLEAYGIHYQLPFVLQGAVITGASIASYSNNPLCKCLWNTRMTFWLNIPLVLCWFNISHNATLRNFKSFS